MGASNAVGVVIVNYRSAELTLRALESLARERAHTGLALGAVVVENASGDAEVLAREIAARFASFARLVISPVNGGFGAGNNLGLRALFDDREPPAYCFFLNPDTEVRRGAVAALVTFLEHHPRAAFAGSRIEHADGTDWPIAFRFPSVWSELESGCSIGLVSRWLTEHAVAKTMGDAPERADWLCGAAFMARRAVLERIGGFDESYFLYFEELDLCLRAHRAGFECWHVPESRVMHIRGQSTGVTALGGEPRRLPRYWFESRRHFYVKNHGLAYAALADLACIGGNGIGLVKRALRRQPNTPHFLRDLVRESVLFPGVLARLRPPRPSVPAPVLASSGA